MKKEENMKTTLLLPCAILLLALLAAGCFENTGSVKIVQANDTANISSPENTARLAALQTELDDLQNQIQSSRTRFAKAEASSNWDGMQNEFMTLYGLTLQIKPKVEENCQLQNKNCTLELASAGSTIMCMNRTDALLDDIDNIYYGSQDWQNCSAECTADSKECIDSCNAGLRELKQNCIQIRTNTPAARQACAGAQNEFALKTVDWIEQKCRAISSTPYLRNADENVTDESPPDLEVLTPTDTGPAILGTAVIDSNQGKYITPICSISAKPDVIVAGKETEIHFRAYAGGGERITYSCGDGDPRSNGNGGLIDTFRICRYDSVGPTTVWVALDGYVCASAPLDVDSPSIISLTPSCRVIANTKSLVRDGAKKTYSAAVRFRHQPANANLSWNCGGETFSIILGDLALGDLLDDAVEVSCTFNENALYDTPGRIYIDYADCGSMMAEGG